MNFTFEIDKTDEKMVSNGIIDKGGIYIGKIINAYFKVSKNGAKAVHFDIMTAQGGANFDIYVTKKDGDKAFGYGHIQSLMGILKLPQLQSAKQEVLVYDFTLKNNVNIIVDGYPDLCDKTIAFILQKNYYIKQDGNESYHFNCLGFLDTTFHRFSELNDGKEAEYYKFVKYDDIITIDGKNYNYAKYLKEQEKSGVNYQSVNTPKTYQSPLMQEQDESLPF